MICECDEWGSMPNSLPVWKEIQDRKWSTSISSNNKVPNIKDSTFIKCDEIKSWYATIIQHRRGNEWLTCVFWFLPTLIALVFLNYRASSCIHCEHQVLYNPTHNENFRYYKNETTEELVGGWHELFGHDVDGELQRWTLVNQLHSENTHMRETETRQMSQQYARRMMAVCEDCLFQQTRISVIESMSVSVTLPVHTFRCSFTYSFFLISARFLPIFKWESESSMGMWRKQYETKANNVPVRMPIMWEGECVWM